jgi:hypothetical protein
VARDASSADVASAIALTVKIEKDLPLLLDEHRAILAASKKLGDVARREGKLQYSISSTACGCTRALRRRSCIHRRSCSAST